MSLGHGMTGLILVFWSQVLKDLGGGCVSAACVLFARSSLLSLAACCLVLRLQ